jgi:hypothetical protein
VRLHRLPSPSRGARVSRDSDPDEDSVPEGVCTAPTCKCSHFNPREDSPMYCARKKCGHSVEWHHMNARQADQ